jgi:hypothetical protein
VVVTDSVPLPAGKRLAKITTLSVAPLIGEAIKRIHRGESVGALFSSEVSFTQEMLLWEDGQQRRMDTRNEPEHESDDDPAGEEPEGAPAAELEAAGLASPTGQGER